MEEVIKIFEQIKSRSSITSKKSIINSHKNNELFLKVIKFLIDPNCITGISKKKIDKVVKCEGKIVEDFSELIDYLSKNNTGSDRDIATVQIFLANVSGDHIQFYKDLITKSYRLGCNVKLVNAVIPELVPVWNVQLGSSYEKLKLKEGEWFSLSQKLNGCRASFYHDNLISRQGKQFNGMGHIVGEIHQLEKELNNMNLFLDGELIRKNADHVSDNENFRIGTGIINSDAAVKSEIKFVIFDMFDAKEIRFGESSERYSVRRDRLNDLRRILFEKHFENLEVVEMVYEGTDQSVIMHFLDKAIEKDWEGLMLNKDATYKCKRTTDLIKIKRFYSMDLPVIDVVEGDGRLSGTLGALIVRYKNNTVNVGSGFNDEQRRALWEKRSELIGRIVEVKYKEITKDKKNGLESLQFPIFTQLREIGKSISYD